MSWDKTSGAKGVARHERFDTIGTFRADLSQFAQYRVGVTKVRRSKRVVKRALVKDMGSRIGGATFTNTIGVVDVFKAIPKANAASKHSARSSQDFWTSSKDEGVVGEGVVSNTALSGTI